MNNLDVICLTNDAAFAAQQSYSWRPCSSLRDGLLNACRDALARGDHWAATNLLTAYEVACENPGLQDAAANRIRQLVVNSGLYYAVDRWVDAAQIEFANYMRQ